MLARWRCWVLVRFDPQWPVLKKQWLSLKVICLEQFAVMERAELVP
jgi:hypothetical protein